MMTTAATPPITMPAMVPLLSGRELARAGLGRGGGLVQGDSLGGILERGGWEAAPQGGEGCGEGTGHKGVDTGGERGGLAVGGGDELEADHNAAGGHAGDHHLARVHGELGGNEGDERLHKGV